LIREVEAESSGGKSGHITSFRRACTKNSKRSLGHSLLFQESV
jgi:hypothetical protein